MPSRPLYVQDALPGMKEGHAEHFVGRRREQQRLLPALRSGDLQIVIITGLGGSGKSTLATRLANKLATYRFIPIPVSSSKENPLNSARLLQAFGDAFRQAARKQRKWNASRADELVALAEDLGNAKISVESRFHDVVAALNEGNFLLILDNFESNMDEADLRILDSEISGFYKYLLENLSGGSRVIITTKYPPSDVPVLPQKAHKEDLSDFSESSFLKILQRDPDVERRIRLGELPMALLSDLYKKFGGTPRFILQIREAIKEMDSALLEKELENVMLPADAKPSELQKLRDKYFSNIFIERLYGYLTHESQQALCWSAVYSIPVNPRGLAAVVGEPLDRVNAYTQSWQKRTFAYQDSEKSLWIVYGLLRPWLLEKLSFEEQRNAHKLAGKFLVDLEELKQEDELGLTSMNCIMEARSQYLSAEEIESARVLTTRLSGSLILSGFYDEVRQLNAELLDYEEHPSSMIWIANAYSDQGNYDFARHWYQRSLLASGDSDLKEMAASWHGLATIDLMEGDYDAAFEKFQKDMAICEQIGDHAGKAKTLHNLATIELKKSNYNSARETFEKILELCRLNNDHAGEASALYALATIDLGKGDYDAAREKFKKVIEFRQYIGDRHGESSTWHQLATIDMKESDYDSARKKFQKSLQISLQIGDRAGEASTLQSLATIDFYEVESDSAKANFERAMRIMRQIGDRAGEASILNNLASIDLNKGEYVLAREKLENAMKIAQQIGDLVGEASILSNQASMDMIKGDCNSAREKLEKAMEIMHQIGDQAGEASILNNLASIDMIKSDHNSAHEELEKAIEIMQQIGDRAGEATAFQLLGILAREEGRVREGMQLVALGWLINSSIHHVDAQDDAKILSIMASELGYTKRIIKAVIKKVAAAYKKDKGKGLVKAAFPKS
ncbi:Tetratricopeptide repeat protein [uncultured archaeon]|nr:Tetratricopeptide repeat protein [uncultured archaeon]